MGLSDRYAKWSEFQQNLFWILAITVFGLAVSVGFVFVDNIGVMLGWLLGSAVNIFAYVSIFKGASYLLSNSTSTKTGYLSIVWSLLRFVLYAGALLLAGFASFKWGSLSHSYCNLIAVGLALMPTWIVLLLTTFFRKEKPVAKEPAPAETPAAEPSEAEPVQPEEAQPEEAEGEKAE